MASRLSRDELNAVLAADAERQLQVAEQAIGHFKSGQLPTPEDIARSLTWRVGEDRNRIMRHHPYWKEHRLRLGFDALIAAALAAHLDLCRSDAALTAFADSREPFEDHIEHTVENPAQKEVMAFCAAYFGTKDTLYRIKGARPDLAAQIDEVRLKTTGDVQFKFILDLRRNLSHGSVTVPGWAVTSDFRTAVGAMYFEVAELLAFGSWSADVGTFLEGVPEGRFGISEVTAHCAKGLAQLRRELRGVFQRHPTLAESDFFRLQDLHRRLGSRQWMKVILQPRAAKGADPYPLLHRFFSPEEVRQIMRLPMHSADQVDYIIALRAAKTDCDDDLRRTLMKLFKVSDLADPGSAA
jgi:hypothetical protein